MSAERTAVVTGATGFIGSHLVDYLVGRGWTVTALVRPTSDPWRLAAALPRIRLARADLADPEDSLDAVVDGATVVFHVAAAGVVHPATPDVVQATNVAGTQRLAEAAGRAGVGRLVYCGSCFEYTSGQRWREDAPLAPSTTYGASKSAGWRLVTAEAARSGCDAVGLRPFTVYGPREDPRRLVSYAIGKARRGEVLELTGGDQARDWVYVGDVPAAFEAAAEVPAAAGQVFNVCTGRLVSVRSLVDTILALTGSRSETHFGARAERAAEFTQLSGDPTRATTLLGWTAETPLQLGLRNTIEWSAAA